MSNFTLPRPIWTAGYPVSGLHRAKVRLGHLLARVRSMQAIARQRRDLLDLDERILKDMGISRSDVERETNRRYWDVDL